MNEIDHKQLKEIPGSYGFPLIGFIRQGLAFKNDWRGFFSKRRDQFNSNVFRSAGGIKAITILDQKGIEPLFDTTNISKLYGFGPLKPPRARIGKILPTMFTNDAVHDRQKDFLLTLLRQRSVDMLKDFESISSPYFDDWKTRGGNFDWGQQLNALWSDFLFGWVVGAKPDPLDVEGWGLNLLPREVIRWPWQGNAVVVKRMERILKVIRSGSHFEAAVRLASDKAKLDSQEAAKQILFYLGFNSWTGIHSLTRSILAEMALNPKWQQKAADEIKSVMGDNTEVTLANLSQMTILKAFIKETLRLHMSAPFAYGKARKDFVIPSSSGDFLVKKGEVVNGAIGHAHRDPDYFENPDSFDPSRFFKPEADQYLIWANGRDVNPPTADNRMCPGRDIVYLLMQLFFVKLLPHYTWTLKNKPQWNEKVFQPANRPDMDFECSGFVQH